MKHFACHPLLAAILLALMGGCRAADQQRAATMPEADASLQAANLFANYSEERLKLYPMEATYAGDDRFNDQLPNNLTDEFRASEEAFVQKYLAVLNRFDRTRLPAENQLSCNILQWECETQLDRLRFPTKSGSSKSANCARARGTRTGRTI